MARCVIPGAHLSPELPTSYPDKSGDTKAALSPVLDLLVLPQSQQDKPASLCVGQPFSCEKLELRCPWSSWSNSLSFFNHAFK